MNPAIDSAVKHFQAHYQSRLGAVNIQDADHEIDPIKHSLYLHSPKLKAGNGPRIFHHGQKTQDVIVLTHGYTDSPFYLRAVALAFHRAGLNVVMPLLPGHGLVKPGNALEDKSLDSKWQDTIDHAVETAQRLGDRISIGGFSTGGALSLNKILRDEEGAIKGGLFLFSAAIGIGDLNENVSRLNFFQSIVKLHDGAITGLGRDPFKYPEMPMTGGMEVGQIINKNNRMLNGGKEKRMITVPVIAAHSPHDQTATLEGLMEFMKEYVVNGVTMVISKNAKHINERGDEVDDFLQHACLPLAEDIPLRSLEELISAEDPKSNKEARKFELSYPPIANPHFDWMMEGILSFFKKNVQGQ